MNEELKILNKSQRRLVKLKLLSNFFNLTSLVSICIKTEIIHSLFKENINQDFEINRLELFHIQFTDSLIELLDKIKKQKEASILMLLNEIEANQRYIDKNQIESLKSNNFEDDRRIYSSTISDFLEGFYNNLTKIITPIDINDLDIFSEKYSVDYYRTIESDTFLKGYETKKSYHFNSIKIEKKLLGRLNIQNFKVRFICGYLGNDFQYELFRIFKIDQEFVRNVYTNEFYLINEEHLCELDRSINTRSNLSINDQLSLKNQELIIKKDFIKNTIPIEIITLLDNYKSKIESLELLHQVMDFDEETNILKAMLNLNLNNK